MTPAYRARRVLIAPTRPAIRRPAFRSTMVRAVGRSTGSRSRAVRRRPLPGHAVGDAHLKDAVVAPRHAGRRTPASAAGVRRARGPGSAGAAGRRPGRPPSRRRTAAAARPRHRRPRVRPRVVPAVQHVERLRPGRHGSRGRARGRLVADPDLQQPDRRQGAHDAEHEHGPELTHAANCAGARGIRRMAVHRWRAGVGLVGWGWGWGFTTICRRTCASHDEHVVGSADTSWEVRRHRTRLSGLPADFPA